MKHKVSFIIPALNEEKRIAALIDNIRLLSDEYDYEIIVSDGHSIDSTAEIACRKGVMVVKDSTDFPHTIANGRNTGAGYATGDLLIFCDADTVIDDPDAFLAEVFSVFRNTEIVGGAPSLKIFPDETILKDKIFHFLFNNIVRFSFLTRAPICGGQCQIVRRKSFDAVEGYNANIVHGEDSDFFRRLRRIGKLHFFTNLIVFESPRRYRHFGYMLLLFQGIYSLVYQQIFKKNVFREWRRIERY
jgi:glycosyltransferase involved in cell wall biosynthesis